VGQQHITTTLKNAIKNHQLAHAFLFCGPRGVGKTTCARILAKTINCENPTPEGEACNHCQSCKSFNEGASLNIHELDAASNNSVEDIRALVEQVRFAPQAGKYKVYIIDEVHMLSSSAFNAFLKTLEEPPPYAIFILATTEKHKILPTILSRCQIFDFKRITLQDTVDHLHGIASKEGIQTDEAGLQMIAQKSEGCMRDALSILDKIVSFTGGQVTYANTLEHLNILDADYYFKLIDCMLSQDLAGAMLLYDDINKKGFEGDSVLNGFAEFVRNLLICKDERVAGLLEVVESFRQRYAETARRTEAGYLVSILNVLAEAELHYKAARNKRLHVEMALIKLCYLRQALQLTSNGSSLDKKKVVDTARAVAFKSINPISVQPGAAAPVTMPAPAPTPTPDPAPPPAVKPSVPPAATNQQPAAVKLIIETEPADKQGVVTEPKAAYQPPTTPPPPPANAKPKLGSLQSLRQQIQETHSNQVEREDQPLEMSSLKRAWAAFIDCLKAEKNPAWQSFEVAELIIKDANSFEAIANNNINQKFLDFERNKVSEFLKHELHNRQIQFSVVLIETEQVQEVIEVPLTSKQQYQKMIEQFPLVKELRERLKLELDF
jgi:DNA polymerase-3 subunit gamma/tau